MHMTDALLSPTVGGSMWVVAGGALAWCSRKLGRDLDERTIPLMGVLGAFVFAAQMINFVIPGTGASGHLGGGLLLAILLGPGAALLTMASILVVQALFFADGGLLALGCNLFNLGLLPCLVGYPAFRWLAGRGSPARVSFAVVAGSVVAVLLSALAAVMETVFSGISELPFRGFLLLMLPIHVAIGVVEGIATAVLIGFLRQARPEIWTAEITGPAGGGKTGGAVAVLAMAAVLTAGIFSWFASDLPDGLEWSILGVAGTTGLPTPSGEIHSRLAALQAETAVFPDYRLPWAGDATGGVGTSAEAAPGIPGLVGGAFSLFLTGLLALLLRRAGRGPSRPAHRRME